MSYYPVNPLPIFRPLVRRPISHKTKPIKALFLLHDFGQGGVARYITDLVKTLSFHSEQVEPIGVIFRSGFRFDSVCAKQVAMCCPLVGTDTYQPNVDNYAHLPWITHVDSDVVSTIYQDMIDQADVITFAGLNEKHSALPTEISFRGKPLIGQLHGTCDWTRSVITYM